MASTSSVTARAPLPLDLYRGIASYIDDKDDLIDLATVDHYWRAEAETILWQTVVIAYDDDEPEAVERLRYLASHAGKYVRHLEFDYVNNARRPYESYKEAPFDTVARALAAMTGVERVDIFCHGDMAALAFASAGVSFQNLSTVKYVGSCSPPLYRFLHSLPNLQSLRFSNKLEPLGDYAFLHRPWSSLTSFSGNIFHVAAMLRSERLHIRELTLHLNPLASVKTGFIDVPRNRSIISLGIGDLDGYAPVTHAQILADLKDAIPYFPNLERIRRAPFLDKLVRFSCPDVGMSLILVPS
jgi:hypothetical protein